MIRVGAVQSIFFTFWKQSLKGMTGGDMIRVRAPLVQYSCVEELVRLCTAVLDEYTTQVDVVMRDIWNEQHVSKRWSAYDRLILGIFSFDEVLLMTIKKTLASTKNRGAIYACTMHREICTRLDNANRGYIHSTAAPDRAHLLSVLHGVLVDAVLFGRSSHLMRLMTQNFFKCTDATGDTWLICPRHKLREYTLALCMGQHARLGMHANVHVLTEDIIRAVMRFLLASTSWDSHPMDSEVEVKVPV